MHNPAEEVLHKVVNPYAEDNRYLYFFSDPPHLLKTIRNCWQSKSRNLWVSFLKYFFIATLILIVQWQTCIVVTFGVTV